MGEILPLCDFFDSSAYFFSETHPGRTAEPMFTVYGSNDVFLRKEVPLRVREMVTSFGGICPSNPAKMAVNRQFQAKTPKYKNSNISKTINPIKKKFEEQAGTNNCTSWVV